MRSSPRPRGQRDRRRPRRSRRPRLAPSSRRRSSRPARERPARCSSLLLSSVPERARLARGRPGPARRTSRRRAALDRGPRRYARPTPTAECLRLGDPRDDEGCGRRPLANCGHRAGRELRHGRQGQLQGPDLGASTGGVLGCFLDLELRGAAQHRPRSPLAIGQVSAADRVLGGDYALLEVTSRKAPSAFRRSTRSSTPRQSAENAVRRQGRPVGER